MVDRALTNFMNKGLLDVANSAQEKADQKMEEAKKLEEEANRKAEETHKLLAKAKTLMEQSKYQTSVAAQATERVIENMRETQGDATAEEDEGGDMPSARELQKSELLFILILLVIFFFWIKINKERKKEKKTNKNIFFYLKNWKSLQKTRACKKCMAWSETIFINSSWLNSSGPSRLWLQ